MRLACLLLLAFGAAFCASSCAAQTPAMAPAYQRTRSGAEGWQARGGHHQNWRRGGFGFDPFFSPFFAPPIVSGSYYQRPYPYHFDYYRHRWGGSPNGTYGQPGVEMIPAAECPCLDAYPTATPPSSAPVPSASLAPPSADFSA